MNAQEIFRYIEIYSPLIPLIFFFIRRSKRSGWRILITSYLVLYIFLVYGAVHFFVEKNNNIVYIILSALTFCFFAFILEQFLPPNKFRTINRTVLIIAVLFFIANAIWWEGISVYNSKSSGLSNFILVSYCVYYYKFQLENMQNIFVEEQPSFWIISGIFIYCAGNFFLFIMFNYLTLHYNNFAYYSWYINDILILVMNIFFAKGIQCSWK